MHSNTTSVAADAAQSAVDALRDRARVARELANRLDELADDLAAGPVAFPLATFAAAVADVHPRHDCQLSATTILLNVAVCRDVLWRLERARANGRRP